MKKYLTILAALMLLNMTSAFAQTEAKTADSTAVKCGETVTITATPDAGYKFLYWDDDHSLTSATREVTLTESTSLYDYVAVFGVATYTVVAKVATDQEEMGTVTGGGNYEFGEEVTLTASPASKCYKFKQWSDGNTDATRTITVAATETDNTYTAEFEYVDFTVKVTTSGGNGSVVISKQ